MLSLARVVALAAAILVGGTGVGAEPGRARLRVKFSVEPARPGDSVTVEVAAVDAGGAPTELPIAIDVDAGKVTPPERIGAGVYRAVISVPRRLPLSRSLLVVAHGGALSAEAALALTPGPAATVAVDGPSSCPEDAEGCSIQVSASDADGNPAADVPDASADLGRVSPAGSAEPGRWIVVYHPRRVDREKPDRITVQLGKLRAVHTLQLVPSRTRIGFAPMVGAVREGGDTGLVAGAQVLGQRLLGSGWRVGAGLEGSWWRTTHSADSSGLHLSTDRSQLAVGVLLLAERQLLGRSTLSLSLGGGGLRATKTDHVSGQSGVSDSGWAPTAHAAAALGYRFSIGMPFVEARAGWVGDAHLLADSGTKWPLFLQLGYRLDVR